MNDSELDQLLGMARGTKPLPGAKARLRSRILAGAAVGGALGGATVRAAATGKGSAVSLAGKSAGGLALAVFKWVGGGVALGVALASLASAVGQRPREPAAVPRVAESTAPHAPGSVAVAAPFASTPAPQAASAELRPEAPRARAPTAEVEPSLPSIERETQLLSQAQRALGRGDAQAALGVLARYDAEFPRGALSEEAAAARAVAACSLGRKEQARAALAAFRSSYPRSPLLRRVTTACSDLEGHGDFETESPNPTTQPSKLPTIGGSGSVSNERN